MKLLVKFNLIFLLVFVLGLGGACLVARGLLRKAATEEIADRARQMIDKANAVSAYTTAQIRPLLEAQMKDTFLPQSVPAYSAAEVLSLLQNTYTHYEFKSAMLNPTNPRDKAAAWEEDLVSEFIKSPALKELVGQRETPTGTALYVAQPIRLTNPVCLSCHSTPENAPRTLVERYGPSNGFGWKLDEVMGAQVVTVSMRVPMQRADRALGVVAGGLAALFLFIGALLNVVLWKLVIQPVARLSAIADKVSMGEDAPAFEIRARDEIGVLSASFGRMRKSLDQALKMLEG